MNTHYALITFDGDFDDDHPDEELRGTSPGVTLIAAGPEEHCWRAVDSWVKAHPLRRHEAVEVVARDLTLVAAQHYAGAQA